MYKKIAFYRLGNQKTSGFSEECFKFLDYFGQLQTPLWETMAE